MDIETRVKSVEDKMSHIDKTLSEHSVMLEERRILADAHHRRLEDQIIDTRKELLELITPIKSGISKILWIIVGAIVLAACEFMIKGGLSL